MKWVLVILLFGPDSDVPSAKVQREFPTAALCVEEREHLARQALGVGVAGRIILWCEEGH